MWQPHKKSDFQLLLKCVCVCEYECSMIKRFLKPTGWKSISFPRHVLLYWGAAKRFYCMLVLKPEKPSPNQQADLDIHKILSQNQLDISSPMALAMCLTLLMFLTSVLTPIGSPGRCTDTLASTLSCPSVRGEKEGSNENHSEQSLQFNHPQLSKPLLNKQCIHLNLNDLFAWNTVFWRALLNSLQQINNLLCFASRGFD